MGEYVACFTKPVVKLARPLHVPRAIVAAFLVFCVPALPQNASGDAGLSAGDLLRRVVNSELKAQADDHSHWIYRLKAGVSGREEEKVVVQTRDGYLARLRLVNGQPITPEQERQEDRRIATLVHKPDEQTKQQRVQEGDARKAERLLKMLPDAVTARYGER